MPTANDLHKGQALRFKGDIYLVLDTQHRTPGNWRAFVQATLRSIRTGKSMTHRFSSTESVDILPMMRQKYEFSYEDPSGYYFLDPETYETVALQNDLVSKIKDFLVENLSIDVVFVEDSPVDIELPASITMKVTESPEGLRGDSATNTLKPATLESGLVVQVPLFIKEGDSINISTTDLKYLSRA